ncbi:DNA binding protein [Fragilaria crotonensis]|nr:DNA binding protein [Fragilaria crotonensis]
MNEKHEYAEETGAQSVNVGTAKKLLDNSDDVKIPIDGSAECGQTKYKKGDRRLEAGESLKRATGTSDEMDMAPLKKRTKGRRSRTRRRSEGYRAGSASSNTHALPMASQTQRDLLRDRMVQHRDQMGQDLAASLIPSTHRGAIGGVVFPMTPSQQPSASLHVPRSFYDLERFSPQRVLLAGPFLAARQIHLPRSEVLESPHLQGTNFFSGPSSFENRLTDSTLAAYFTNLRTGRLGMLDSVGLLSRRQTNVAACEGVGGLSVARALASQPASAFLTSFINRHQFPLALARERSLLTQHATRGSHVIASNVLGMNIDPPGGALITPTTLNDQQENYLKATDTSFYPVPPTLFSARDITGTAAMLHMDQRGVEANDEDASILLSESFPVKLHHLLLDLQLHDGGAAIASFLPDGVTFAFHDVHRFETEVMKTYFPRMNKFASFQRQLNLYDFQRIPDGPARAAYCHPSFNRDFPHLCRGMKRTKIKGARTD